MLWMPPINLFFNPGNATTGILIDATTGILIDILSLSLSLSLSHILSYAWEIQ